MKRPADVAPARRETRQRRWSLLALVVALPLTFAVESHDSVANWLRDDELVARDVPAGGSTSYIGDEWRLDTFKVITGGDPRLEMPKDRAFVVVRLASDVGKDAGDDWSGCQIRLTDATGRQWLPLMLTLSGDLEKLVEPDGRDAPTCGSASLAKPKAGAHVLVEEKFLVPRDALATLRATLSTGGGRPYFLRFAPPTSAGS